MNRDKAIPIQVWKGCQNFKTVGTLWWQVPLTGCFYPQDMHLVLISVTD
jgi:hypothetical protein